MCSILNNKNPLFVTRMLDICDYKAKGITEIYSESKVFSLRQHISRNSVCHRCPSVWEIGLHTLVICWCVQTGMFTSPIHSLRINGLFLFWKKSVQKDQLEPSSFHDRHSGVPLGYIGHGEVEREKKRLMTTSISHIQREMQCSLASNPCYCKHMEEDVTLCLPRLWNWQPSDTEISTSVDIINDVYARDDLEVSE
jgi:hypothetical protein